MFNRKVVQKALKQTWELDDYSGCSTSKPADDQSSMTSRLIYDVFGGKILKICKNKGWHFYNRIDGEPVDFTVSEMDNYFPDNSPEEQPATPEETRNYFAQEDYFTFYVRFISAFEEIIGLKKYRRRTAA
jgi:hypothetical protein